MDLNKGLARTTTLNQKGRPKLPPTQTWVLSPKQVLILLHLDLTTPLAPETVLLATSAALIHYEEKHLKTLKHKYSKYI